VATDPLTECLEVGDSELLIAEGVSAARALKAVRARNQAVLAMQGKIPNVDNASKQKVINNDQISNLLKCLHPARENSVEFSTMRYQRILLVSDPDVDGQHAQLLLMKFFCEYLPHIVESGALYLVRVPRYAVYEGENLKGLASTDAQLQQMTDREGAEVRRFKGLASIDSNLLRRVVGKDSRQIRRLSISDLA